MTTTFVTANPPTATTPVSIGVKTSVLTSTMGTAMGMGSGVFVTVMTTGFNTSTPTVCLARPAGSGEFPGVTKTSGAMTVWNCVTTTSPYVATRLGATVKTLVVVEASTMVDKNVAKDVEDTTLVKSSNSGRVPTNVPVKPGATGIVTVLSMTTALDMVTTRELVEASTTVDKKAGMVMLVGTKVTKVEIGTKEPEPELDVRDVVEEPATLPWEPPLAVSEGEPDEPEKMDTPVAVLPVNGFVEEELPDNDPLEEDAPLDVGE